MIVVGVDGCPDGWVAVVLADDSVDVVHVTSIDGLDEIVPAGTVVAVDIPMWFPTAPPRRSEIAARSVLGAKRASSIFPTPIRAAIDAPDHATANALSKERTGRGVSAQAYALTAKIREVDAWRARTVLDVREVHPETSFAVLLDGPAVHAKKTWSGTGERRRALAGVGIDLTPFEGRALGRAAVDDVVDAGVAAWTARRIVRGEALRLPEDADPDPDDVIWA
jgi:predicted RNase H-like nuclease